VSAGSARGIEPGCGRRDEAGEIFKEIAGEFLRRRIDQARAELRELAADLRFDFIVQDSAGW
jgi:hypothetical protein